MTGPEFSSKEFVSTENQKRYTIDLSLQRVLDDCIAVGNSFSLSRYLFVSGSAGKDPLSQVSPRLQVVDRVGGERPCENIDEIVAESAQTNEIESIYNGQEVLEHLFDVRKDCISEYGKDKVELVEKAVGIDSIGIDMGDPKPLLGLDIEKVKIAWHYVMHRR